MAVGAACIEVTPSNKIKGSIKEKVHFLTHKSTDESPKEELQPVEVVRQHWNKLAVKRLKRKVFKRKNRNVKFRFQMNVTEITLSLLILFVLNFIVFATEENEGYCTKDGCEETVKKDMYGQGI